MTNLGARKKAIKLMLKQAKPKPKVSATPTTPMSEENSYQGSTPVPRGTIA